MPPGRSTRNTSEATRRGSRRCSSSSFDVVVGPAGLDPELLRLGERLAVGVDADDLVPAGVRLRQCAVAAAEIEHVPSGPAHVAAEELHALRAREDETGTALDAVVLGIAFAELLEAHDSALACRVKRTSASRRARATSAVAASRARRKSQGTR